MPRERPTGDDVVHVADILRFAREVVEFVRGKTWDDYQSSVALRRMVERSVELIGEAARRVSDEFEAAHPEIPWNRIIVQRHRIAHEYDTLDDAIIWSVATKYVPLLIKQIEPILPPMPPDPDESAP
ncbi:MAG: HepT-like ribonuclease domain-containing protein [Phycisphaerales bacterium]